MAKENINWCDESTAMQMLGYTKQSLRILSRNKKIRDMGKGLPIRSSKLNHKTILYSKTDIENFINEKSKVLFNSNYPE